MIFTDEEQEFLISIVNRIDVLRVSQSYSIYELSQKANISENTLKGIFKKKGFPNVYTLLRLCNALEISLADFFLMDAECNPLNNHEIELLTCYRSIHPPAKKALLEIAKHLSKC